MTLTIDLSSPGKSYAVVLCDLCHKPIKDLEQGMLLFWYANPSQPFVVHKGMCDRTLCSQTEDISYGWWELSSLLKERLFRG